MRRIEIPADDALDPRAARGEPDRRADQAGADNGERADDSHGLLPTHQLGHAKCEVERLPGVEARVAEGLVASRQLFLEHGSRAAQALRHVLAGELEVDAAGPDGLFTTHGEERDDLV